MHVSSISIKTGTVDAAQSDCRAVLEICDSNGKCCQTSPNGQGLDNPGMNDREHGQIDIYTKKVLLGTCARKVNDILALGRYHRPVFDNIKNSDPLLFNSNLFYLPAVSDTLRPQGFLVGEPATANLTTSDPGGDNGWITSNVNS